MIICYCVKCKKKVEMKNPKEVLTKNNRKMLTDICFYCGTKICKFIK